MKACPHAGRASVAPSSRDATSPVPRASGWSSRVRRATGFWLTPCPTGVVIARWLPLALAGRRRRAARRSRPPAPRRGSASGLKAGRGAPCTRATNTGSDTCRAMRATRPPRAKGSAPQPAQAPCSRAPIPGLSLSGCRGRPGRARPAFRGPEVAAARMGEPRPQWSGDPGPRRDRGRRPSPRSLGRWRTRARSPRGAGGTILSPPS